MMLCALARACVLDQKKKRSFLPLGDKQQVVLSFLFRRLPPMRPGVDAVPSATLNHISLLTQTVFDQLIRLLIRLAAVNLGVCVLVADAVTHPCVR